MRIQNDSWHQRFKEFLIDTTETKQLKRTDKEKPSEHRKIQLKTKGKSRISMR